MQSHMWYIPQTGDVFERKEDEIFQKITIHKQKIVQIVTNLSS